MAARSRLCYGIFETRFDDSVVLPTFAELVAGGVLELIRADGTFPSGSKFIDRVGVFIRIGAKAPQALSGGLIG
jgi:hypothetical protein